MLVLTRKRNEEILIGSDVRVKVLRIENGVVKLGIDAPSDVPILRDNAKVRERKVNVDAQTEEAAS